MEYQNLWNWKFLEELKMSKFGTKISILQNVNIWLKGNIKLHVTQLVLFAFLDRHMKK